MKISAIRGLCLSLFVLVGSLCGLAAQNRFSTIVIDPGHGGKDPGAIGKKYREKNLVLDISLKLGKMLNDSMPATKVVFTRTQDEFIPLNKRAEIANKNNADLFVSIHANSSRKKTVYGAETFVLGLHKSKENLEVAQKENSVITLEDEYTSKYEGFDPSQPESYIIFELMQNVYLEQSISFASSIQNSFVRAERFDRGVKQAGFLVLRQTSMPGVLVELGFISDPAEEEFMASKEGAEQLVAALYNAIREYGSSFDGHNVAVFGQDTETALWPDGVNFRLQVAVSSKERTIEPIDGMPVSMVVEDDKYKYMMGIFQTHDEASDFRAKVKKIYPDCFVVAYKGREKLSVRAAKKEIKTYK